MCVCVYSLRVLQWHCQSCINSYSIPICIDRWSDEQSCRCLWCILYSKYLQRDYHFILPGMEGIITDGTERRGDIYMWSHFSYVLLSISTRPITRISTIGKCPSRLLSYFFLLVSLLRVQSNSCMGDGEIKMFSFFSLPGIVKFLCELYYIGFVNFLFQWDDFYSSLIHWSSEKKRENDRVVHRKFDPLFLSELIVTLHLWSIGM